MALATMNSQRSRQMAIGLLVAAIVVIGAVIAIPVWMVNRHYDNALGDYSDKLARYRGIAAARPLVTRQLDAMRAKDTRKFFLRSGTSALAAAEVQETLRALVESSGGRLITMQGLTPKDEGRYRQIGVNVQLTANIIALRKILHQVESNTPYLFIENLLVRSQVPANFKPQPGNEPEMFVQFDVYGYALTGS
jgi:general secretion pathway protein M